MDVLETKRLTIRPFQMDDFDDFNSIFNHELGWWETPQPEAYVKERLQYHIALGSSPPLVGTPQGPRALVLRDSAKLIGMVGFCTRLLRPQEQRLLRLISSSHPGNDFNSLEYEIGYGLESKSRGQGFATEAVQALVHYAFSRLRLPHIIADADASNARSIRLMERIGMTVLSCGSAGRPDRVIGILHNGG